MVIMLLLLFIVGTFFGSFYACIANRLSKNESIIKPGSHCENCKHRLTWYELIPVFSYLIQGGKCRKCRIKLSPEYIIVEIATGILFALSFYLFEFSYNTLIMIILSSLLITIYVSDFKYMVILDEVLIPATILLLIVLFLSNNLTFLMNSILRGLVLFILLLSIKLIGDKVFKQESLGWGDVKLSFIAGLVLGFKLGLVYLFLGAFIALPYGLYGRMSKKELLMPFGPFLITSMWIVYAFAPVINGWINILLGV